MDRDFKLSVKNILALMAKEDYKHLRVKCFFLVLISNFLMPSTTQNINVNAIMYTQDMASIKYFDWCTIVYENLRSYVNDWQLSTVKKYEKKKTVTIPGCIIIPLVSILVLSVYVYRAMINCIFGWQAYIVDNMKLLEIEDKKCPRINQYTIETLMDSIRKARRCHGRVNFNKFVVLIIYLSEIIQGYPEFSISSNPCSCYFSWFPLCVKLHALQYHLPCI